MTTQQPLTTGVTKKTPGRTALRLEERDLSLLCDLFTHGAMLRVQVQALHFPSLRRCNRRLRQLFMAGCVAWTPLPLGTQAAWLSGQREMVINEQVINKEVVNNRAEAGFGSQYVFSSQYVYRLGPAGAQPVAQCLGWNEADVRRLLRPGSPLYLAHALEGVRFRLLLTQAVETGNVRLLRFLPERLLLHAYEVRETGRPGAPWRREVFKPDAFFEIALLAARPAIGAACEPYPSRFFVEIDLGHTSAREFANKVRIYRRYQGSGLFEKRYGGTGFRTLVCTTSPTRRDNLRRIVEGEGTDLFWLSTLADIANPGPFAPVWHVPFRSEPVTLLPK